MNQKIIFTLFTLFTISFSSAGQTKETPWADGFGLHWLSEGYERPMAEQIIHPSFFGGPFELSVHRYISRYCSMNFIAGSIRVPSYGRQSYKGNIYQYKYYYLSLNANIYYLAGILKENAKFKPYINFGLGLDAGLNEKYQLGLGAEYSLAKRLSVYGRMEYVPPSSGGYNYLHPHLGITYSFGGKKDKDKDGIPDKKDRCPVLYGPAFLQGCPDTDGDGIQDIDDKCPAIPGTKANQGCPE